MVESNWKWLIAFIQVTGRESCPSPILQSNSGIPQRLQANFSLDFPDDDSDFIEMSPPRLKPEKKTEIKPETKAEVKPEVQSEVKPEVKPELKPESEKRSNMNTNKLEPGTSDASAIDHKSVWDDGFELNWSDIEEIEVIEQCALAGDKATIPTTPARNAEVPVARKLQPPEDDVDLKLEMEEIFGRSKATDESAADTADEVILLDDSSDCLTKADEAEEESPMLRRRRLNPGRNILMTQSTPIARKVSFRNLYFSRFSRDFLETVFEILDDALIDL